MQPDRVLLQVARKELQLFFASPVAWLFLASFMVVCLFTFFWVEAFFARNIADVRPLFEWMPLLLIFLSAALTMRSWSEERRSGTLEHVLTQPVALWQFVAGKFLACATILLLALVATLPLPFTVASIANLDWGPVLAAYLASLLLGCAYLAVGLFVSSRTDNGIVSLIGSVAVCGLLYLAGSELLLGFFGGASAELLRLLGSGSRFESITRGVIDLRDLYYYVAITVAFLAFNVYGLERGRWSSASNARHRAWQFGIVLLIANLFAAGLWLHRLPLRADVTEGRLYSLSEPSRAILGQLDEPLLIRGYFSERSHPLLAPLVPQLRDLLREYAVAGGAQVRVEFVDLAEDAAAEQEANEDYGISATPFQVADRYQSALVNAYFDVLVQYGGEYETLGFADFIEVKTAVGGQPEVLLRNPEFDVTRAMRDVLYRYRSGGQLFDQIQSPVTLRAYVSGDALLPQILRDYRDAIRSEAEALAATADGKFSVEFVEPEAGDGAVAERIIDTWDFRPMIAALGDENEFFFYLTLEDDHQVIQVPTGRFAADEFGDALEAGLRRFASGFTRTVALALPTPPPAIPGMSPNAGLSFQTLQQGITRDHTIDIEDLSDGSVDPAADLLVVVAPEELDEQARFAIDQYLMRGGTVVLATAPWSINTQGAELQLRPVRSGLEDWLAHHGISIDNAVVLDERQAAFPVPVVRRLAGFEFRDMQFVDYPYLLDIRDDGLNAEHPITASLPQVTVGWASAIEVDAGDRRSTVLLSSSDTAWRSTETNVMPSLDASGQFSFAGAGAARERANIAVLVEGEFSSAFDAVPAAAA
ncbi:MAG: Gldg family protein, partial [Halieaceae bacterium]|nr:Gldg family protein [Halieaceae bacterium]